MKTAVYASLELNDHFGVSTGAWEPSNMLSAPNKLLGNVLNLVWDCLLKRLKAHLKREMDECMCSFLHCMLWFCLSHLQVTYSNNDITFWITSYAFWTNQLMKATYQVNRLSLSLSKVKFHIFSIKNITKNWFWSMKDRTWQIHSSLISSFLPVPQRWWGLGFTSQCCW